MSKIRTQRKGKNFFITGSDVSGLVNKTTVSSSIFTKMSQSFADGEHLLDDAIREPNAGILFMLQEMQDDMDDIYTQISVCLLRVMLSVCLCVCLSVCMSVCVCFQT